MPLYAIMVLPVPAGEASQHSVCVTFPRMLLHERLAAPSVGRVVAVLMLPSLDATSRFSTQILAQLSQYKASLWFTNQAC